MMFTIFLIYVVTALVCFLYALMSTDLNGSDAFFYALVWPLVVATFVVAAIVVLPSRLVDRARR